MRHRVSGEIRSVSAVESCQSDRFETHTGFPVKWGWGVVGWFIGNVVCRMPCFPNRRNGNEASNERRYDDRHPPSAKGRFVPAQSIIRTEAIVQNAERQYKKRRDSIKAERQYKKRRDSVAGIAEPIMLNRLGIESRRIRTVIRALISRNKYTRRACDFCFP